MLSKSCIALFALCSIHFFFCRMASVLCFPKRIMENFYDLMVFIFLFLKFSFLLVWAADLCSLLYGLSTAITSVRVLRFYRSYFEWIFIFYERTLKCWFENIYCQRFSLRNLVGYLKAANIFQWLTSERFIRICAVTLSLFVVLDRIVYELYSYCLAYANRIFYITILYHHYSHKRERKVLSVSCRQVNHDYVTSENIVLLQNSATTLKTRTMKRTLA